MKSTIIKISTVIIVGLIAFIAGRCSIKPIENIKIVKETETEFKYIHSDLTDSEKISCYDNKLDISVKTRNNWVDIIATDKCKLAKKSIKIAPVVKNNFIFVNYGLNKSIQVNYYKKIGNILIGGGVGYPGNVYLGAGYNF